MKTILELLSEIRWSPELDPGDHEIGYYDRVERTIIRRKLASLYMDSSDKFAFTLRDGGGRELTIPYHRIKRVWRKGELIWSREIR